jgi:hypothetical protein
MSSADAANLVIGVLVLACVLCRQLITRRLSENYRLSVILAIVGVLAILAILAIVGVTEFATFLKGHPSHGGTIAVAVVGGIVIAAVFGAARALTVRVWRTDGQLLRQGTWLTAAGQVPSDGPPVAV